MAPCSLCRAGSEPRFLSQPGLSQDKLFLTPEGSCYLGEFTQL